MKNDFLIFVWCRLVTWIREYFGLKIFLIMFTGVFENKKFVLDGRIEVRSKITG